MYSIGIGHFGWSQRGKPSFESKIRLDGYIETGKTANVFLTMSSPYLTHYDSVSIRNTFLNYAKITISSSKGEKEVLTLYRENRFFPPFVYKSVSVRGQEGVEYQLKVEVGGRTLSATTTIPGPPVVVDAFFDEVTDTTGNLKVGVEPPEQSEIYLFTQVRSRLAKEAFHPSYDPVTVLKSSDQNPTVIRILRSTEFGLYYIDAEQRFYNEYGRYEYDLRDTVDVIVGSVDSASYRVLNTLFRDRAGQENPFAFNGNRIETNIEGGIGRWTGIGISGVTTVTSDD